MPLDATKIRRIFCTACKEIVNQIDQFRVQCQVARVHLLSRLQKEAIINEEKEIKVIKDEPLELEMCEEEVFAEVVSNTDPIQATEYFEAAGEMSYHNETKPKRVKDKAAKKTKDLLQCPNCEFKTQHYRGLAIHMSTQ